MRPSDKLALSGGAPAIDKSLAKPIWPETLPQDEAAVVEAVSKNDLNCLPGPYFAGCRAVPLTPPARPAHPGRG